ncbi:folate-binding protein [Pasteurella atlantica]|uniref:CAF17-like 4Fe-4S cluster assembly/insertion protein YgfZ n=1 Tax=Pasteurellaceae TaxID=712 RepID=UPI002748E471|nr:folate-binding protein [Pasteurella atlantica]MDP8034062.1 folate-binding protein [Pasteurella atlantica]MDP8036032.1 folate-binding protein [Pasteurella atlantica]MDP8037982.1 folate-binding protein [Pasteurella atlantica]MDP8048300.1 folate-binding protein [Pasteurella atlantica]MDP8050294.1 folate-binding protein [Pasteurella atlantica]
MIYLKQYKVIEVAGLDAQKFLQGQLTCDVAKLEMGKQTLTAHCDPKGKVSGLWRLYRQSENQFLIIIHQDLLPEAIDQLKKYAIFSKVTFTEKQIFVYGCIEQNISGEIFAKIYQNHTACQLEENSSRHIILSEHPLDATENSEYWDLLDIQNGIPILLKQNRLTFIPQALNLQDIEQAISFKKGCYIGQETVARAKYRGANKRAMFTLVGTLSENSSLPDIGSAVEMQLGENWKSTGTILYSLIADNQLWVQVVLNNDISTENIFRINETKLSLFKNN